MRSGVAHMTSLGEARRTLAVAFFGTSIMEHLEAFNTQMTNQAALPPGGTRVTVEGWHRRGWVHRLALSLRATWPHVDFDVRNHGEGGATSRTLADIVATDRATTGTDYDLVFIGCGINDVWRRFQGRTSDAVHRDEYAHHLHTMLGQLRDYTRQTVVVSETPFGPVADPGTVAEMNAELARYNEAAAEAAAVHGALFLDVWGPFTTAARYLGPETADAGLWSDGVHLTELGDTVLLLQAEKLLGEHCIVEGLLDYSRPERDAASPPSGRAATASNRPTADSQRGEVR
ncbi:SGNH/GDSL hydrolase family protein [Streptacidiphilus sp. MAP5-52]|uniref:SGNH/GDSL hydrolase family protein n=1 Tax=Streptacidiphilus sp. MAP5-52 TaxID=3156267 RepID=UPI003518CB03